MARPGEIDDDEESLQDDEPRENMSPAPNPNPPVMKTMAVNLTPKPGDTVQLPCDVENGQFRAGEAWRGVAWRGPGCTVKIIFLSFFFFKFLVTIFTLRLLEVAFVIFGIIPKIPTNLTIKHLTVDLQSLTLTPSFHLPGQLGKGRL